MEELDNRGPEDGGGILAPRRPKPGWYHYVVGLLGSWVILIPLMLMTFVEFPPPVRNSFLTISFLFLIGGTWWWVFRSDSYMDEFELATTREVESISFRFTAAAILGLELLRVAGVSWDYSYIVTFGLLWNFAGTRVHRRIRNRMAASANP